MGYDPQECNRQLTAKKLQVCGGTVTDPHCIDFNNTPAHAALCPDPGTSHIYDPVSGLECYNKQTGEILYKGIDTIVSDCQQKMASDPNWTLRQCYCCCSCFAFGTPIATPAGMKAIEDFIIGDEVLVASEIKAGDAGVQLTWTPKQVAFSSGTGPDIHQASMIYVRYGEESGIVVTPDHVFLMPNGKLKRADRLVPFQDSLVLAEGGTAPISEVHLGALDGGIHHISTDLSFDNKVEGHMLNANGVVCADYLLQIHLPDMSEDLMVENHSELPKLGSAEYAAQYTHLFATLSSALPAGSSEPAPLAVKNFSVYSSDQKAIPDKAKLFINPEQEADIISNPKAEKQLLSETIGISAVNHLIKVYNAFYPDVWFHLDWEDIHINAYAFNEFGRKIVYISGGLARMVCLDLEGMALIMAQQLGYFYAQPQGKDGFANRGLADYYGVFKVTRDIFYGNSWFDVVIKGLSQLQTFFSYITADNAKGEDGSGDNPSIACRIQTFSVAMSGGSLPPCAGGVVPHQLAVVDAVLDQSSDPAQISVTFNSAVDKTSAQDVAHYTLTPQATIDSAELSASDTRTVVLTASLEKDTAYVLTVSRVTTVDGSNLDPAKTTAQFTTGTSA